MGCSCGWEGLPRWSYEMARAQGQQHMAGHQVDAKAGFPGARFLIYGLLCLAAGALFAYGPLTLLITIPILITVGVVWRTILHSRSSPPPKPPMESQARAGLHNSAPALAPNSGADETLLWLQRQPESAAKRELIERLKSHGDPNLVPNLGQDQTLLWLKRQPDSAAKRELIERLKSHGDPNLPNPPDFT
jgi:hypothetical protein